MLWPVFLALLGLLAGSGLVAFFTSRIVEILTATNHFEQMTRLKIGRVQSFMRSAKLPPELVKRWCAAAQPRCIWFESNAHSMNESPYCGVNSMAKSRKLRKPPG